MITPEHTSSAPHERSTTYTTRTDSVDEVDVDHRGTSVDDTATEPGDIPIRTTPDANESGYPPASATDERHTAEAESGHGHKRRSVHIKVDDGHVIAAVDPALTDAAADVLLRIVAKAPRKD